MCQTQRVWWHSWKQGSGVGTIVDLSMNEKAQRKCHEWKLAEDTQMDTDTTNISGQCGNHGDVLLRQCFADFEMLSMSTSKILELWSDFAHTKHSENHSNSSTSPTKTTDSIETTFCKHCFVQNKIATANLQV